MEYWHYKVVYFSDLEGTDKVAEGIVCAESWTDAMNTLVDMYGKDDLETVELLDWVYDHACLEFTELNTILNSHKQDVEPDNVVKESK